MIHASSLLFFQINRSTCKNLREKFLQAGLAVEMSAACLHRIS